MASWESCYVCGGSGKTPLGVNCSTCGGLGRVDRPASSSSSSSSSGGATNWANWQPSSLDDLTYDPSTSPPMSKLTAEEDARILDQMRAKHSPEYSENVGIGCYNNGDYDKAIEHFNEAIKRSKHYDSWIGTKTYMCLGLAYNGKGDYNKALDWLNKSISLESNEEHTSEQYYNRGIVYINMGNREAAIADWKKAADIIMTGAVSYYKSGVKATWSNMDKYLEYSSRGQALLDILAKYGVQYTPQVIQLQKSNSSYSSSSSSSSSKSEDNWFYWHSEGLFIFALIASIACTVIGGLLGFLGGFGYGMLAWSAFCLILTIIFRARKDNYSITGEGVRSFICLVLVIAGGLFFGYRTLSGLADKSAETQTEQTAE